MDRHNARSGFSARVALGNTWALVLAAGEGSRLKSLTLTPSGISIPKQFCSLHSGPSLLEEALYRGLAVARREYQCVVVASQHRGWWSTLLAPLAKPNVVVQPENRGTANGILLPLLHIIERDPEATIVLFPSDHHVADEAALADSLRQAVALLAQCPDDVLLLGIEPDDVDPELGYIVPSGSSEHGSFGVACFAEKPSMAYARELIVQGGLWNSFILAAKARTLLALFASRVPEIVAQMSAAVRRDLDADRTSLATVELYARLPVLDFSRHILQGREAHLRVLPVPRCGWSDLGTPKRVFEVLRQLSLSGMQQANVPGSARTGCLSLAAHRC